MPAFSHILTLLLLLFTLTSAQIRGDYSAHCVHNDAFGTYCPTTCGVENYFHTYESGVQKDLSHIDLLLEEISNLTRDAQNKVVYLKDSQTQAQKSSPDVYIQKSSSMLDDVLRFERSIITQAEQILELQSTLVANGKRLMDLKQISLQLEQRCKLPCKDKVTIETITGKDCQDIANKGGKVSGLYYVQPLKAPAPFLVYCEIDEVGRGWTVLQRRRDGSINFNRNWIPYKEGFGYLSPDDSTEFWLGNERIHQLSVQSTIPYVLRIELEDWEGNKKHADYAMFKVGPEADQYRLTYGYYFGGDAGDSFDGYNFGDAASDKALTAHYGMQFSTPDRDNDKFSGNCAQQDGSGWWMNHCHAAHLNGKYYTGGKYSQKDTGEHGFDNGIIWATWHDRWYSLKQTTMKIIPINRIMAGGQSGVDVGKGDFPTR